MNPSSAGSHGARPASPVPVEESPMAQAPAPDDVVMTLPLVPGGFDRFLEVIDDRVRPRIKYRAGSPTLVSPSHAPERCSDRIDDLVKAIGDELDIPIHASAVTLFRPAEVEPDNARRRRLRAWARDVLGPRRDAGN